MTTPYLPLPQPIDLPTHTEYELDEAMIEERLERIGQYDGRRHSYDGGDANGSERGM